jgi:hypothetical protein
MSTTPYLCLTFLFIMASRIFLPLIGLAHVDLALKQLVLSATPYVFHEQHWFYGHRATESYDDGSEKNYVIDARNFDALVQGTNERKDLIIHSIAWGLTSPRAIQNQVANYYLCANRPSLKRIRYEFTYRSHPIGAAVELECIKDSR